MSTLRALITAFFFFILVNFTIEANSTTNREAQLFPNIPAQHLGIL